jgi:hypothetical protein
MSTSPLADLFRPTGSEKISLGTLGYVRARNRQRAYNLIVKEFKKSGLSQVDLAKRLGKGTDVICRLLSRPGNWELDTFSDLLFGICGSLANFVAPQPLSASGTAKVRKPNDLVTVASIQDVQTIQSQPTAVSVRKKKTEPKMMRLIAAPRQAAGETIVDVSDVAA